MNHRFLLHTIFKPEEKTLDFNMNSDSILNHLDSLLPNGQVYFH